MHQRRTAVGYNRRRLAGPLGLALLVAHMALILGPGTRLLAPQLVAFREQLLVSGTLGRVAAYDDDWAALFRLAESVVPPTSAVLFVSRWDDLFAHYRASYALYPRTVWWAGPGSAANLSSASSSASITHVLVDGLPPDQMAGYTVGRIWWFDAERLRYVAEVGPP